MREVDVRVNKDECCRDIIKSAVPILRINVVGGVTGSCSARIIMTLYCIDPANKKRAEGLRRRRSG